MNADAILITQPSIDFTTLLSLSHQALGYSIAAACDSSRKQQSDAERFLSCLAALRDPHAAAGLAPNLLTHIAFSVLIACDERDMLEVMECASGIAFVYSETVARGILLAVASGSMAQWRDAVVTGSRREGMVRLLFNKVMGQFEAAGLNVWQDFNKRYQANNLFLLEDKRR